jgi:radical SAM superfamily enzyme YgiQ (UPF0313 family)
VSDRHAPADREHDGASLHLTLVKPPIRVPKASYSTLRCPPIGLAYLGAAAREAGHRVTIVDAVGEYIRQMLPMKGGRFLRVGLSDEEIAARIPESTRVLGVTCAFSEEWPLVRGVIEALRRARPDLPIVAGGEHVTAAAEFSMRNCPAIDYCVLGEGEETLVELLESVAGLRPLDSVAGIAWMEGGEYRKTGARSRIKDVDAIPRPAWDLIPLEAYLGGGFGYGIGRGRSMPILATRGCPYQCTFCSSPQMWTTRWSARDPQAVLDEIGWAIETYRADNFDFYDLTAILRKEWLREFCEGVIERGYRITWQIPSGTRSEALDGDTLPLMRRAGCSYFAYAPESGSPAVLARIKKKVRLERMKDSMRAAVAAGISTKCNMIFGFPGETRKELMESVRFVWNLASVGVADVNIGPFCPYPGSELFDSMCEEGRVGGLDDAYFDMLANYSDVSNNQSWSEHFGDRTLTLACYAALAGFYLRAFLRNPGRVLALVRNVYTGRHQTRLDRAVGDMMDRLRAVGRARLARLGGRGA